MKYFFDTSVSRQKMLVYAYIGFAAIFAFCICNPLAADAPVRKIITPPDPVRTFSMRFEPENLAVFRNAYPDVSFTAEYDIAADDWRITVNAAGKTDVLYWAGGRFVPEKHRNQTDMYWTLLYPYAKNLADPADFSKEEIERIRSFSSDENRRNGAGTPPFLYDVLYDCAIKSDVEKHIVTAEFLGKRFRVHERLLKPLAAVERKINALAQTDADVRVFIRDLAQIDGYFWRTIRDTSRRSFHSVGIAVDILPVNWGSKIIYWNWQKSADRNNWMLTPLSKRWMPPESVISIFESEGFIWGGKWTIWDNMHFEYHPELILFRDQIE